MNIGKVSQASGVSTKMIRYYEQIGLIPTAGRNNAGYRSYSSTDVERLKFIKRSRELGFSVVEISDLLDLWNDRNRQSADVKRLALGHIEKLEQRFVLTCLAARFQSLRDPGYSSLTQPIIRLWRLPLDGNPPP